MTLNCIWRLGSSFGTLKSAKSSFVAITPRSTYRFQETVRVPCMCQIYLKIVTIWHRITQRSLFDTASLNGRYLTPHHSTVAIWHRITQRSLFDTASLNGLYLTPHHSTVSIWHRITQLSLFDTTLLNCLYLTPHHSNIYQEQLLEVIIVYFIFFCFFI